jgi:hypothetical protein
MKKLLLVLGMALAFGPVAMGYDIAFYVGAPNTDGWYDVASERKDVDTIIAKTGQLFKDVQRFDDARLNEFAAWIDKNTNDGELDIIWLNGCTPSVLYQFPNLNADGSRAEKWLDGGNMIINVGDWFAYCSYEGGSRQADNGGTGAANILDLSSGIIAGSGQGAMEVTPAGQEYLPSLNVVASDRPIQLSAVVAPWEVAEIFAQNAGGTYADPVVIHNTATGGYVAFINQASTGNWISDRGLACAEFIGNWVREVVGLDPQPFARGPNPADGSMIDQTQVQASWQAGDFAALHDVYFGDSFDKVSAATPEDTDVYVGRQVGAQLAMGMAGGVASSGLTPGKTYYWRVDEINTSNPAGPWKGAVWSFQVQPQTAWNPTPADGAKFILPDQVLNWNKGLNALFHYVHLGEDRDAVKNAAATAGMMTANTPYTPGALKPGTTYYWRVDEFVFPTNATVAGDVWSFTTVPEIPITDPSLSGHWPLDEGAGTTAIDWSGHGGHGTLIGGPEWVDGLYGGALSFSGAGPFVDCGDAAADVTGDFTLAAWIKLGRGNRDQYLGIAGRLRYTGTVYEGFALVRHSGNVLRLWVGDGTGDLAKSAVSSDVQYTDLEWHHVAGTHEGQKNSLFVDGKKQAGTSSVALVPSPEFFHLGRQYSSQADRCFNGLLDDVRIYNKAMTEAEIQEILRGDPAVASSPEPGIDAILDIRGISSLRWSAGEGAASHDVYFGTDRQAVTVADHSAAEFKGNQPGTSFSLAGLVALGGGDYFWRIDEVEAGGAVHAGYVWKFTVPGFLIVDDFEGYNDDQAAGRAVFQTWIDGIGPDEATPGNGTGALVGNAAAPFAEQTVVHSGQQAMPFDYNNVNSPYYSEATRTWTSAQDWTAEGMTTLVLYVRGVRNNDATQPLYVALENQGKTSVVVSLGTAALNVTTWTEFKVPLSQFAGVNLAAVTKMYLGVGDRANPKAGGHGKLYIDDIRLIKE